LRFGTAFVHRRLHPALMATCVGPGHEVIVPDVTWIATSAPVSYVGAIPVFADFEPSSWCITASSIKAMLTPRTKAVIGSISMQHARPGPLEQYECATVLETDAINRY
jgi:DegT/DnrJ/EryC1/StrS aminotransferase family